MPSFSRVGEPLLGQRADLRTGQGGCPIWYDVGFGILILRVRFGPICIIWYSIQISLNGVVSDTHNVRNFPRAVAVGRELLDRLAPFGNLQPARCRMIVRSGEWTTGWR